VKNIFLVALLVITLLVISSACTAASEMELPEEAQKLTDVVPAMGEHWADPADLPLGPIFLVYEGEVIGIEYMWSDDMLQEVEIPTPEGSEHLNALVPLPVGVVVNHVDYAFMPHGHEGFDVPHHDLHMYFITPEEKADIMP
jgi:hypothetical protein